MFVFVDNVWRISLPFIHLFNVYWTFRYICERASRRRRTSALHIKDESINLCLLADSGIGGWDKLKLKHTHTRRISHVFHSNKATVWHPKHSPAPLHILNTQIHSTHNPHIATNTHIIKAVYYIVISRFVRSLSPSSSLAFITYKIINSNFPIHKCLGFFFSLSTSIWLCAKAECAVVCVSRCLKVSFPVHFMRHVARQAWGIKMGYIAMMMMLLLLLRSWNLFSEGKCNILTCPTSPSTPHTRSNANNIV